MIYELYGAINVLKNAHPDGLSVVAGDYTHLWCLPGIALPPAWFLGVHLCYANYKIQTPRQTPQISSKAGETLTSRKHLNVHIF